ncbi:hypothetical protein ACWDTI_13360 [Gordonia sp. NPDC003424]
MNTTTRRITAAILAAGAATTIGIAATGAAHAGTMPITRPGEPTTAMTITNHTNHTEYLLGATAGQGGHFINAPQHELRPGTTETITAVSPFGNYLTVNAAYRIGAFGPTANYEIENMAHNTNTAMSGISGPRTEHYFLSDNISSSYPTVNVGFQQW